jgi:hypothetical protein
MVTVTLPLWVVVVVLAFGRALIAMQGWRILLLVQGNAQRRELAAFARHWRAWQRSRAAYEEAAQRASSATSSGFQPRPACWPPEFADTRPESL